MAPGRRGRGAIAKRADRSAAAARLLAAEALTVCGAQAAPSDFFGPAQGWQIQPEMDFLQPLGSQFRLIPRLMPTIIPSQSYGEMGLGVHRGWLASPFVSATINPDIVKRQVLDVRPGIEWSPSLQAGSAGESNPVLVDAEATPRLIAPGEVLVPVRDRAEARWQLASLTSFGWRVRFRPRLEREFVRSASTGLSLTPSANAGLIWSTSQNAWDRFRMQAGVQLGAERLRKGQIIELSGSLVTYLQPSRSDAPEGRRRCNRLLGYDVDDPDDWTAAPYRQSHRRAARVRDADLRHVRHAPRGPAGRGRPRGRESPGAGPQLLRG
jgi:hypothetical protein